MEAYERIEGHGRVTAAFGGRWPAFHDAEVVRLVLDRCGGPAHTNYLDLVVHAWQQTDVRDAVGHFERRDHVLVHLRFADVDELSLDDFNRQNVLFTIRVNPAEGRADMAHGLEVELEPAYGLGGRWVCGSAAVIGVERCDATGRPLMARGTTA